MKMAWNFNNATVCCLLIWLLQDASVCCVLHTCTLRHTFKTFITVGKTLKRDSFEIHHVHSKIIVIITLYLQMAQAWGHQYFHWWWRLSQWRQYHALWDSSLEHPLTIKGRQEVYFIFCSNFLSLLPIPLYPCPFCLYAVGFFSSSSLSSFSFQQHLPT